MDLDRLTSLYLDPPGLHRGHVEPLLGVDLSDVVAGSQSPQRVPGALIPSGWSNCSLVFCDGGSEPESIQTLTFFFKSLYFLNHFMRLRDWENNVKSSVADCC